MKQRATFRFCSLRSSGNVKTPISQSSSRNKEKKVVQVQKPVVEQRQEEEVESKYVRQKSRANSLSEQSTLITRYCLFEIKLRQLSIL